MKHLQQQNSTPKQEQEKELSPIQKRIREAIRNNVEPYTHTGEFWSNEDFEFYYDELVRSSSLPPIDDDKPISGLSSSWVVSFVNREGN